MNKAAVIAALACLLVFLPSARSALAQEILTRIVRVQFDEDAVLRQFNKRVDMGTFSFRFGSQDRVTVEEEVKRKVNLTIARVQEILEMYPQGMKLDVVLFPSEQEVQRTYREQFNLEVKFIAFYSPKTHTAYFSVPDVNMSVFAHELAHAVIDHYFDHAPPVKIHELLAQYVESQMGNY